MKRALVLLLLLLCVVFVVVAQEAPSVGDDPAIEKRLHNLSQELRCLVCQNETLADSRADLAIDLRNQIREQMKAGKTDKEIIAYLTQRYGDFVLYSPPVRPTTYLLWFGPFILMLGGLLFLFQYVKQRRALIADLPLSIEERQRAEKLLSGKTGMETK